MSARLESLGITTPLPIQTATIPEALAGRDVVGKAPTGTGKTLAFGLPIAAASVGGASRAPLALVLVPTRELAEQVRNVIASLMPRPDRVVSVYGGTGYEGQRRALRKGVDVVVACPGRLEDLVQRGDVRLDDVRTVVLDEADRMVDMGFLKPVCRLMDQTAARRQVLLFSATIGREVETVIARYLRDPHRHEVRVESSSDVTHLFWRTPRPERISVTAELIAEHGQAFVFCRTKHAADRVAKQLRGEGVHAVPIHGDRSQSQRERSLAEFASGRAHALVATDVVARGIHVDDVPCVVHFDPPEDASAYLHRSGRTGRSGRSGTVVSLVADDQHKNVRSLQRDLGFREGLTSPVTGRAAAAVLERPAASHVAPAHVARPERSRGPQPERGRFQESGPRRRPQENTGPRRLERQGTSDRRDRSGSGPMTGTVKFFDIKRGYGFLAGPDGSEVFVHHSKINAGHLGGAALRKGERVTFELGSGRRGSEAHNVTSQRQSVACS